MSRSRRKPLPAPLASAGAALFMPVAARCLKAPSRSPAMRQSENQADLALRE